MTLTDFPQFRPVDLTHRDIVNDYLSRYALEASEYTFTNMFAFQEAYDLQLSRHWDNLVILKNADPVSMFCPIGNPGMTDELDDLFRYLGKYTSEPLLERVPESFVENNLKGSKHFLAEEQRDHFDYIYSVNELIGLKGRKYHDKKNKANKFRSLYEYEYVALTPGHIGECLEFEHYWCEVRDCGKYPGLEKERCAILKILRNFAALRVKGGAIRVGGRIAALTLGEKILPDTMVIHVEKANADIPGLYQVINQEFLMHEARDCEFVNREQDLGIEGLRAAKMTYNPVRFVRKFTVREK